MAAIQGKTLAASLPMVALGAATAWLVFSEIDKAAGISRGCPDALNLSFRLGNHKLDKFLCVLVHLFKFSLQTHEGIWVVGYLLTTALSAFAFLGVEGSRDGSGWLLSLTPAYAFLIQVMGISIVVPLLWLPIYFLSSPSRRTISPVRVAAIGVSLVAMELLFASMLMPLSKLNKEAACYLFQPAPIIASALWLPFRQSAATNSQTQLGHKLVMLLHSLAAGAGLVWHLIATLLVIFHEPDIPSRVLGLLWERTGDPWCTYFLLVDAVVLFVAFVYLSAVEHGLRVAAALLLGSLLVGPAASLSFYFVYREHGFLEIDGAKKRI